MPSGVNIPCFVTWPYDENPNFIGREDELEQIHTRLYSIDGTGSQQRVFALTGLGGMGKTQISVKYAFKYRKDYHIVLLAHASGQSKLAESFSLFADKLGLGAGMSPIKAKQAVKDFLGSIGKYLL
jgi:AAA+ ATPase superfamily predicted ATPase